MVTEIIRKMLLRLMFIIFIVAIIINCQLKAQSVYPSDEEIRNELIKKIDYEHESIGMVVGIITPEGRRIISYGHLNQNDPRLVDGNTIFELGSVTKVLLRRGFTWPAVGSLSLSVSTSL